MEKMSHTFFTRVKLHLCTKYLKGVESNAKEMLIARGAIIGRVSAVIVRIIAEILKQI
jgi:hypothetical protein